MKTRPPRLQYLRDFPSEVCSVVFLIFAAFAEFGVAFWQTFVLGRSYEEQMEREEAK